MPIVNMQDLFNVSVSVTAPITVNFATAYPKKKPSLVYAHAVLSEAYTDATGMVSLPAGTWLKAAVVGTTKAACTISVTSQDGKTLNGALVNLTCAAFE